MNKPLRPFSAPRPPLLAAFVRFLPTELTPLKSASIPLLNVAKGLLAPLFNALLNSLPLVFNLLPNLSTLFTRLLAPEVILLNIPFLPNFVFTPSLPLKTFEIRPPLVNIPTNFVIPFVKNDKVVNGLRRTNRPPSASKIGPLSPNISTSVPKLGFSINAFTDAPKSSKYLNISCALSSRVENISLCKNFNTPIINKPIAKFLSNPSPLSFILAPNFLKKSVKLLLMLENLSPSFENKLCCCWSFSFCCVGVS